MDEAGDSAVAATGDDALDDSVDDADKSTMVPADDCVVVATVDRTGNVYVGDTNKECIVDASG